MFLSITGQTYHAKIWHYARIVFFLGWREYLICRTLYIWNLNLIYDICIYIVDEVESLAAARQAAISGSEPSDSIRVKFLSYFFSWLCIISLLMFTLYYSPVQFQVVNALLTQMDKLKSWPNVIILTTSNITTAIGIKFPVIWLFNHRAMNNHLDSYTLLFGWVNPFFMRKPFCSHTTKHYNIILGLMNYQFPWSDFSIFYDWNNIKNSTCRG